MERPICPSLPIPSCFATAVFSYLASGGEGVPADAVAGVSSDLASAGSDWAGWSFLFREARQAGASLPVE